MRKHISWLLLAALFMAAPTARAQAVTVSGVKFDEAAEVRGARLHLNGAGLRYKAVFKVYAAGLYLPKRAGATEDVLAMGGAKRVSITMLRDIDSGEFGKLFSRGMQDNLDKTSFSRLIPGVLRMSQLFSDCKRLSAGDSITIDWVPGTGTVVTIDNPKCPREIDPFREPEFFNALLRIWIGTVPADYRLKDALLGKA